MVLLVGDKGETLVLLLILCSVLVTLPNIGIVEASGTIYIRADGSIEGTDKIQRDGNVYTFTDNIYQPLVVEKENIIIDGAGHTIEGPHNGLAQSPEGGILVDRRGYVTIQDIAIQNFLYGICINTSFEIDVINSNITNNCRGVIIEHSSEAMIRESQITNNLDVGIYVLESSDAHMVDNIIENNTNAGVSFFFSLGNSNSITSSEIRDNGIGIQITMNSSFRHYLGQNNIINNRVGIDFMASSNRILFNNIEKNEVGIQIAGSGNRIDHNTFINNTKQVHDIAWDTPEMSPSVNTWYDGDTGNYWSDYNGTGDTAYVIDENNQDLFPITKSLTIPQLPWDPTTEDFTISNILWSITIIAVLGAVLLIYFRRLKNTGKIKK